MRLKKSLLCLGLSATVLLSNSLMASTYRLWNEQIKAMPSETEQLEQIQATPLVGFEIAGTARRLSLMVLDQGCTELSDFVLYLDKEQQPAQMALSRTKLDECDRAAVIAFVTVEFDQLGMAENAPFELLNPVILQELSLPLVKEGPALPAVR